MKKYLILAGVLLGAMVAAGIMANGCGGSPEPPAFTGEPNKNLPVVQMRIGSGNFALEVTQTEEQMHKGLKYRRSMPADRGMIFPYTREHVMGFYMEDCYIPLDILFLDAQGKIISIRQLKPLDVSTVSSDYPAQYAIELNQGTARRVGVKEGDVLTLPALPQ